jgi:hypothetical protein
MVFLGFGKYVRADRIYALEPITGDDRGSGSRTLGWVEGLAEGPSPAGGSVHDPFGPTNRFRVDAPQQQASPPPTLSSGMLLPRSTTDLGR